MRQMVNQLAVSNNNIAKEIETYRKTDIVAKALEAHWMQEVLLRQVENCGTILAVIADALDKKDMLDAEAKKTVAALLPTEDRIKEAAMKNQEKDMGLEVKPNQVVEMGDVLIMGYQLYDMDDNLIDDRLKDQVGYDVGCNALGIDEGVVSMVPGETRFFEIKVSGSDIVPKEHVGKNLKMQVLCKGVRSKKK